MSRYALWLSFALIVASSVFYYPKWKQSKTEATISWDVSGYYLYLPATLIYKDITQLKWWAEIEARYQPGPGMGQAVQHPSGHYVMKYPMGQALQFLPWFLTAHVLAEPLGYPADGFSFPYQVAISFGSLLVALLGLWFLRRVLLLYFSDGIVAAILICLVFGSNYLEYAGITGAMTHNWLFTLYSILIFTTIRFYERPDFGKAAIIGLLVGWATLTRPTEIISMLIPLLWGIGSLAALRERVLFFRKHLSKIGLAVLVAAVVMSFQAVYWKYATGEWIVYSYEEQGFSWLKANIAKVLWSARAGWLVYSPMMAFAVIGLFFLPKRLPDIFWAVFIYCITAFYITAAWDIWWYGGSLGQRALVQSYPLWAFPLGAFLVWISAQNWRRWVFVPFAVACIYINIWWSHQAHRGGLFLVVDVDYHYIWKIMGRLDRGPDAKKFLDTKEEYTGSEKRSQGEILNLNFDSDTTSATTGEAPIAGARSLIMKPETAFSPGFELAIKPNQYDWLRASASFRCDEKEMEVWKMTQFTIRFQQGEKVLKNNIIRLQRHVDGSEIKTVFFDTKIPSEPFDRASLFFWNPGSSKAVRIDDVRVEVFE